MSQKTIVLVCIVVVAYMVGAMFPVVAQKAGLV